VTFTPTDAANYTGATATTTITVLKASTHDQLVGAGGHHLRHGAERDAAERDRERAGQLRLHAGRRHGAERRARQTLSVTFTPTDAANYTGATATTTITVLKASTTISWSAPADITYGTALSATQLNATANVPGSFVYSPVAGTVLTPGAHTLSVTFTPTDAANYTGATATTTITVLKASTHDQLVGAGGHHLRHGAERDAAECDRERAGRFVYSPVAGTVLNAGRADAVGDLHADDAANYTVRRRRRRSPC
jgi:hypothetical protein